MENMLKVWEKMFSCKEKIKYWARKKTNSGESFYVTYLDLFLFVVKIEANPH